MMCVCVCFANTQAVCDAAAATPDDFSDEEEEEEEEEGDEEDEDELAAENAFDDDLIDQVTFELEAFYARENPVKKSMAREIATNYSSHLFLFNAKLKDTYGSGLRCIDSLEQVSE